MNHLAHFHLADPQPGLLLGALRADFYKGPISSDLDPDLAAGIMLHRRIDAYTDQHPASMECRRKFSPAIQRYAGILQDLAFDHFLARHWDRFCDHGIDLFCARVYTVLKQGEHHLCERSAVLAERLERFDVLSRYQNWDMVAQAALRTGERFKRGNPFIDIETELQRRRDDLESTFIVFYPELLNHVAMLRRTDSTVA
jgi:acyl carrier protein phosphodiesterase